MKVYRHMNAVPIAVRWPNGTAGSLSVLGRPLLPYERTQLLAIDPDTLVVDRTWNYDSAEESVSANKDRIAAKGPRS
jgi:hypothetical protein